MDSAMINTPCYSKISKVKEQYPELFQKLLKDKKKSMKVVTIKEVMSLNKSNKRKREANDKEYSKNDSPLSVGLDVEKYDSNNYIGEDGGKKLEFFESRDDYTSEYPTMIDTGLYFDQYCNQTSNNANSVLSHENVLTGNNPLQCDVCFRMFIKKSKLYVHKRTHTGEKPYVCDVYGNSFSQKGNLVTHYRTHTGEKPYACSVCGRSFAHISTFLSHKTIHTGDKPHACDVCRDSFSKQGNLVTHYRTHTGKKPYACSVCGRSFSQQGTLVTHLRIHTGERPYECGQCEKKFSSNSDCTKHTRTVHFKCF